MKVFVAFLAFMSVISVASANDSSKSLFPEEERKAAASARAVSSVVPMNEEDDEEIDITGVPVSYSQHPKDHGEFFEKMPENYYLYARAGCDGIVFDASNVKPLLLAPLISFLLGEVAKNPSFKRLGVQNAILDESSWKLLDDASIKGLRIEITKCTRASK